MVPGPMGNCAKRPRHRGPKVGGLTGRGEDRCLGWTLEGSSGWAESRLRVKCGHGRGMDGLILTTLDRGFPQKPLDSGPPWSWLLWIPGPPLPSSSGPPAAHFCSLLIILNLGDAEPKLKVSLCHWLSE